MFSKKRNSGFSLIEVLIAMAIMSSATLLIYMAWTGNQIRARKITINNTAAFLLDQIVSELEIKYAEKFTQLPDTEGGSFDNHPKFTWTMKSKEFEMPDLRSILISGDQGDEMTLLIIDKLTEYLNESVKEMQVTVLYKHGKSKKPLKFTATTVLVDYNKSIPLGGGGGAGF